MVRSNLQYSSSVLKPHTKKLKDKLENVQKKQHVNYVTHNFYNTKSVSNMLHHLYWPALFHRINICRLSMLNKITHIWFLYLVPQTTTITPSSSLSDLQYTYWLLQIQLFSSHRNTVELLSTVGGISSLYAYWQCRWV